MSIASFPPSVAFSTSGEPWPSQVHALQAVQSRCFNVASSIQSSLLITRQKHGTEPLASSLALVPLPNVKERSLFLSTKRTFDRIHGTLLGLAWKLRDVQFHEEPTRDGRHHDKYSYRYFVRYPSHGVKDDQPTSRPRVHLELGLPTFRRTVQ